MGGVDSLPSSPPKFAFNGISTDPPKSFQQSRARSGTLSDESMARKRALEEESGLYPPLVAPNLFGTKSLESPIIPLSPDPFGRYPTPAEYEDQRQSQVYADDFPAPPTSYFYPGERPASNRGANQERPPSHTPSSRFSVDSVTSQDTPQQQLLKPRGTSALISVKSIRKLWKKSGNKGSVSGASTPTIPDSGRSSPNVAALAPPVNPLQSQQAPSPQPQPTGRPRSKSISKTLPLPPQGSPLLSAQPAPPPRESYGHELPMRPHHFEGEARFPRHPSLRPPQPVAPVKPSPSPPLPPPPSHSPFGPQRTPSPSQRPPSLLHSRQTSTQQGSLGERGSSVRKSILKSWKSATGLSSHNRSSSRPPSSSITPGSSAEHLPETTGRKRRPSVLELAGHAIRGSTASASMTLVDIPPSPALPEQYLHQAHSRAGSRQSQMNGISGSHLGNLKGEHMKAAPSLSSTTSSPPRVRSPLHNIGSPPRSTLLAGGGGSRTSQESFESRPSFDVSQFEMVSPPKTDSYILESTLSYPYHGLDHSMTTHE